MLEENDFFGEFDFDFDMEGLPPEAKQELERALKQAQKQAAEARVRAFTLRRDAQGQRELHEPERDDYGNAWSTREAVRRFEIVY